MKGLDVTRLRQLAAEHPMSFKAQAELMGFKRSYLYQYTSGKNEPNLGNLKRIASFYGVTTDYLLGMDKGGEL